MQVHYIFMYTRIQHLASALRKFIKIVYWTTERRKMTIHFRSGRLDIKVMPHLSIEVRRTGEKLFHCILVDIIYHSVIGTREGHSKQTLSSCLQSGEEVSSQACYLLISHVFLA